MLKINHLNISFAKPLFNNQNLEIKNNCLTLLVGESGCGKTTLLYKLGLIDFHKKDCSYQIDDTDITEFHHKKKTILRRYDIAFVFQDYILYDHFNVYENIQYYASLVGNEISADKAKEYLHKVHLDIPLDRSLYAMSGGQKQRLAIACALTKETPILILDEPTSALDTENARIIFEILSELKKEKTIIITSHNQIAREYCDEVVQIEDGIITKIVSKDIQEKPIKIIQKGTHLPLKTYFNYLKKQYYFSKKMKVFIAFVNIMIIIFCLVTSQVTNNFISESKSIVSKDNPGWMYVPSLQKQDIDKLKIDSYYPYYNVSLNLLDKSYPVVPYYDEININNKIWTRFDLSKEQGFYFSHKLYYKNSHLIVPTQSINFYDTNNHIEISLLYKGILLKGLTSEYIDSSEFIYMHQKLIEEKLKPTEISGYTLFCHNIDDFTELKLKLENLNYKVTTFSDYDQIISYIEMLNTIQKIVMTCLICFGLMTLYFLYRSYFHTREKEFALLKCIGLTNMNIITLVLFESFIMNILSFIIMSVGIYWFVNYSLLELLLFESILLLGIGIIISIMTYRLQPIQVLRNE
ncbi:MAG: ABC transporter ATP-binding protein [Longibaculum muris]|uniref:ABC-type lipoprotein export system ATPase subunit n=1 Tax=Longibaculum muris TaxID=1796628 RepID=A0A4R3YFK3_9FIRM|nr:ABC transporter ATP-binding protein [Longibaculum muris]KXU52240.1 ABC transporter, ATP-binding protein [Candidatus Stoquefichus sp. KLE1796]MBS5370447.1 ABC transporter ATP-binding protein [Coprobacillus cateniformis]MCR1889519.1 ABC transporter ATP-binding protein [Longibaculum muris]MED9813181.1 ABC transporter ATP-binding protein [Longibaculum muris]TCV90900.1 ABC-type lipoprotein export system ATPase subunit [Longibaculum muris]